jgi:uncharacterized protein (DUF433 family)
MAAIVRDEDIRSGDPRIEGTRITVLDIKRRVIENEENPHIVAGEYDVSLADLFRALTYYYDHPADFAEREREAEAARRERERYTRELIEQIERGSGKTGEQAD